MVDFFVKYFDLGIASFGVLYYTIYRCQEVLMRLRTTKSAHSVSYSVIKSAYVNKKRTTVTVEILGNAKDICEKYGVDDEFKARLAYVARDDRIKA